MKYKLLLLLSLLFIFADKSEFNYDESQVPAYTLPDPLVTLAGERITTSQEWEQVRRPEILQLFTTQMYGAAPEKNTPLRYNILESSDQALGGKATRKQVRIFLAPGESHYLDLLIYIPNYPDAPAGGFLAPNFGGNHTINADPYILLTNAWVKTNKTLGINDNKATEESRGSAARRWPVERIIERGYMLATVYYGEIDPDTDDFSNGIHPVFYQKGQTQPAPDEWGAIAAWAWGLSRAMDYLVQDTDIDPARIAVMGHSRLGKTALWAGVNDPRFAIVISNNSGCGGAALSRRHFGETVARINTAFPHWFCDNFNTYNENESQLPFDQHMLLALVAPRPLYVASAVEDRWADPRGEFLSARHASPVYQLYGLDGLTVDKQPELETPVMSIIGYHIRKGKHDVTLYDWERYMDFADQYMAP